MLRLHHRSARIALQAGQLHGWLEEVYRHLRHLPPGAEVALDLSQLPFFDFEELAALAEIQSALGTRGHSLVLTGLQPQPLALLTRLGVTRQLGVRRTHRQENPRRPPFQRAISL
ncbi:STAS domain-containing protein [bacterium]|nr:STAS domain-containing protein [bacterium]